MSDLIRILKSLDYRPVILVGEGEVPNAIRKDATCYEVPMSGFLNRHFGSKLIRMLAFPLEQILVAMAILRLRKEINFVVFVFFLMPVPTLLSRLLSLKSFVFVGGVVLPEKPDDVISRKLISILEGFSYKMAKRVLVVSSSLMSNFPLNKYSSKTLEAPVRFVDEEFLGRFSYSKPSDRSNIVGFISRLSWEKGTMKFIQSIPLVASEKHDVGFLIVGDGPLRDSVQRELDSFALEERVTLVSWTDRVEDYLKRIKLLVVPSISEGIPSIVLEAMACGTPVLVRPLGGLRSLLRSGKDAFLLDRTDAEHLAERILKVLSRQDLDYVSSNAYDRLLDCYGKDKTLTAWKHAFEAL
ncbi:glycosyltransferase [Candidatus Bathyarchaeota archaeon]|nr:glycosyltransferase [Candidatus Bathyarchaeota archaeon]